MSARTEALFTLAAGAATLALTQAFAAIDAALVSPACAEQGLIVRFQLAGAAEMRALFAEGACADEHARSAHVVNTVDVRLFIAAYTLFVIGAVRVLAGSWLSLLGLAAILFALGAAIADVRETLAQLAVTSAADIAAAISRESETILWSARAKYAFLAANALCFAALAFHQGPPRPILAALALLAVAGAAAVTLAPTQFWYASIVGFAPFWIALLVVAVRSASRA